MYNGTGSDRGSMVALGDYHLLRNTYYNDPNGYGNHSALVKNIMSVLAPNDEVDIVIDFMERQITSGDINFTARVFDPSNQAPITELINGSSINASIVYSNGTEKSINLWGSGKPGLYIGNISLDIYDNSTQTLGIEISASNSSELYTQTRQFYFYPDIIQGYENLTYSQNVYKEDIIDRNNFKDVQFALNISDPGYSFDTYLGITPPTFMVGNGLSELHPSTSYNPSSYEYALNFVNADINSSGYAYQFSITNNSDDYMDLTPDRYKFAVQNYSPIIFSATSKIIVGSSEVPFSSLASDGYIIPLEVDLATTYTMVINTSDSAPFEDSSKDLSVTCSLWPILVYGGYINLMFPHEIPLYGFDFDNNRKVFSSELTFPSTLNFTDGGEKVSRSIETDLVQYYSILWIQVRDRDGGVADFMILLLLFEDIPDYMSYTPLLVLAGILGLLVFILNKWKRPTIANASL